MEFSFLDFLEESTGMITVCGRVIILMKLLNKNMIHQKSMWDAL
jgi:hypothetical protein